MNQLATEKFFALEIDVDQWRRDIKTFVESTINELQAINDELSHGFAVERVGQPVPTAHEPRHSDNESITEYQTWSSQICRSSKYAPFTETQTDNRLAALKQNLATRISGSDPQNTFNSLLNSPWTKNQPNEKS